MHPSPYSHKFGYDRNVILCKKTLTGGEVTDFSFKIQADYHYRLYIDGLPSASVLRDKANKELPADYYHGIPIGKFDKDTFETTIYNHLDIIVVVHDTMEGHHRIVGFEVEPYSINEGPHRNANNPSNDPYNDQHLKAGEEFTFSYRIITRRDPRTNWSMRMDHYAKMGNNNIEMANIIYSLIGISVLVTIIGGVFGISLRMDCLKIAAMRGHRRTRREHRLSNATEEEQEGLTNSSRTAMRTSEVAWKKL